MLIEEVSEHRPGEPLAHVDDLELESHQLGDGPRVGLGLRAAAPVVDAVEVHQLQVHPRTRYPCSCNSAAATEESTPPLMATRTGRFRAHAGEASTPFRRDPGGAPGEQLRSHGLRERAEATSGAVMPSSRSSSTPWTASEHVAEGAGRPS